MTQEKQDQLALDIRLDIATIKQIDGVQMGVFEDGTPFLSETGLAKIAGVSQGTLNALGRDYGATEGGKRLRAAKIAKTLSVNGFEGKRLYEKFMVDGTPNNAYYDVVCMAILKYYAFQAGRFCNETAESNYDMLAAKSFKDFVYQMVGYKPVNPEEVAALSWKNLQERLLLNPIPAEYFSVIEESYPFELKMIRGGLRLDQHTIPDISIGSTWGRYWTKNDFDKKYKKRVKHPHVYPNTYAQSKANDWIGQWIYPMESVLEFKQWLKAEYATVKLPKYLKEQVKKELLPAEKANALLKAVAPVQLPAAS